MGAGQRVPGGHVSPTVGSFCVPALSLAPSRLLVSLSWSLSLMDPQFSVLDTAGPRVCLLSLATLDRSLDQEVVSVSALTVPSLKVSWSGLSGSLVLSTREMEIRPAGRILCVADLGSYKQ